MRLAGAAVPWAGLGLGLAALGAGAVAMSAVVATEAPGASWVVPGVLLALVGAAVVPSLAGLRSPLLPLGAALGLAGLALQRSEGLQLTELVFAAYYLPYLVGWYALRVGVYREPLARSSRDWAVVLFLWSTQAAVVVGVWNGAEVGALRNDWTALSMMAFYFPVRELCVRYENGVRLVLWGLLFIAFASLARNLLATRAAIETATYAWEVARVRVLANEMILTAGAIVCAAFAAVVPRRSQALFAAAGFAALAVGVVLTQWRAYYVSLTLAVAVVAALSPGSGRRRIAAVVALSATLGSGILYVIFGDGLLLLAYGVLDRFLSIGTATTADISLINRFYETQAVLGRIAESPVFGHGTGTAFAFFDLTTMHTWVKPYAHNGYLTLWFKFGLIGLAALLWMWGRVIVDAARTLRIGPGVRPVDRVLARASLGFLVSIVPSFAVSAPFTTSDTVLCFTVFAGLAAGIRDRYGPAAGGAPAQARFHPAHAA